MHVHIANNILYKCTFKFIVVLLSRVSIAHSGHSGAQLAGLPPSSVSDPPSTDADDRQIQALRSQIRLSETFSGVKLDSVSWEITHKGTCTCLH